MSSQKFYSFLVIVILVVLTSTGCEQSVEIVPLEDSLQPLKSYFNKQKDKYKLISILSPSYLNYFQSDARYIQKGIEKIINNKDIIIIFVWIDQYSENYKSYKVTQKLATDMFYTPRIQHFYDNKSLAGKIFGELLNKNVKIPWYLSLFGGKDKTAVEVYMFFRKGSEWGSQPPMPTYYIDQCERYAPNELPQQIENYFKKLIENK